MRVSFGAVPRVHVSFGAVPRVHFFLFFSVFLFWFFGLVDIVCGLISKINPWVSSMTSGCIPIQGAGVPRG